MKWRFHSRMTIQNINKIRINNKIKLKIMINNKIIKGKGMYYNKIAKQI